MTTPIGPIAPIGALTSLTGPAASASASGIGGATPSIASGTGSTGTGFAAALADGLDQVAAAQSAAGQLAVQAATGQLTDPAQYTIAATQAALMTQLATTVQSKAVTAFNTIMGMQA